MPEEEINNEVHCGAINPIQNYFFLGQVNLIDTEVDGTHEL